MLVLFKETTYKAALIILSMRINPESRFVEWVMSFIVHYNHKKYWRRREVVVNPNNKKSIIIKLLYLLYIKRTDAKWHCTFGTSLNGGSTFASPPTLWHGPNGIIMGYNVRMGRGCIICQHVTISHGAPVIIGDNCLLGPGCFILAGVKIGNNVKIGANAVVVEDIPDYSTVVAPKPRIIIKSKNIKQ